MTSCRLALIFGLLLLLAIGAGCRQPRPTVPEPEGPSWFVDVTEECGLDFVHDPGSSTDSYFMPRSMGSGAAFFDFDNDGRLDLYLIQNAGPRSSSVNRLFRQTDDRKFVDVTKGSGLDVAGHGMGVAIGDIDNDGLPDVCVTEYGRTRLFHNRGKGKFEEITQQAGIDNPLWGSSACFVDYDRDGWLDLIVVNYIAYDPTKWCGSRNGTPDFCHPGTFPGTAARLYHNITGSTGKSAKDRSIRFADQTLASGLARVPGAGLGVVCDDFDGDGWPDLFVANDSQQNRLWINQKNGTFVDQAVLRGVAFNGLGQTPANMGIALGDVDGDGRRDLFVTHLSEETHALWAQRQLGSFQDHTAQTRLASPRWRGTGFGTILADFDHDGWLDLAIVNGRVYRDPTKPKEEGASFWAAYAERNQLFANDKGRFRDISESNNSFCEKAGVARGLTWGDFDNDGAVDLLVTTIAGRARLYRNVAPDRGNWLLIRAVDPQLGGRDAYGAVLTVQVGKRRIAGLVCPGQSYLVSGDPRVHFGLGQVDRIDSIDVDWPDGTKETFLEHAINRSILLRKGQGSSRDKVTR